MSTEATSPLPEAPEARLPWFAFLFVLAVFAVASFDPLLSVDYVARRDETTEARLEASVQRTEAGNMKRRIAISSLGGLAVVSLLRRQRNRLGINGTLGFAILCFLLWTSLSIFWSHDQALTLRRLVLLGALCLGALAAAERFSFREITYFVFFSGYVALVAGLLCELGLGTFRPWDPEYRFCGTMNPIFQGAHCGTVVIAGLALSRTSRRARFFYIMAALVALLFMLLTRSRGPSGATLVAVVAYWTLSSRRFRRIAVFLGIPVAIVLLSPSLGGGLFTIAEDSLLLGRPVERGYEMQGRDALWHECLKFSAKRPFLGYGYDAFWTRDFTFAVTDASGFTSQHTHNAFLDLLLGIGIPGAAMHTFVILLAMKALFSLYRSTQSVHYASALALLILYVLHNLFVSVHLAAQLQTFVILIVVAKVGFVRTPTDPQGVEATEGAMGLPEGAPGRGESIA